MEKPGFFKSLSGYLESATLTITAKAVSGGKLSVVIIPTPSTKDADPALSTPIAFTGTPEELDEQALTMLQSSGEGYKDLTATFEAIKAVQDEAKKKATEAAAAKKPAPVKPATKTTVQVTKPAPAETPASSGDDDNNKGQPQAASATAGEATAATETSTTGLFD